MYKVRTSLHQRKPEKSSVRTNEGLEQVGKIMQDFVNLIKDFGFILEMRRQWKVLIGV